MFLEVVSSDISAFTVTESIKNSYVETATVLLSRDVLHRCKIANGDIDVSHEGGVSFNAIFIFHTHDIIGKYNNTFNSISLLLLSSTRLPKNVNYTLTKFY